MIEDGGPAFPSSMAVGPMGDIVNSVDFGYRGMSIRHHFACLAMQAMITTMDSAALLHGPSKAKIAEWSYAMADAMLIEGDKGVGK